VTETSPTGRWSIALSCSFIIKKTLKYHHRKSRLSLQPSLFLSPTLLPPHNIHDPFMTQRPSVLQRLPTHSKKHILMASSDEFNKANVKPFLFVSETFEWSARKAWGLLWPKACFTIHVKTVFILAPTLLIQKLSSWALSLFFPHLPCWTQQKN